MSTANATLPFQAEVKELLGLMIHSLYSHPEIFLRELLSNASDALDKLRFEALTKPELTAGEARLAIRLELEREPRVLRVRDNGIGMSRQELVDNLGTIARSGTRRFLEQARAAGANAPELIGQFGVGFYASFMVADLIVVETRRAGEEGGTRWTSRGDGEYTLEELAGSEGPRRGTRITLHLKPVDSENQGAQDFADPEVLRELVRKYSDFVEWPIELAAEHFENDKSAPRTRAEDGVEVLVLNSQKPLWVRPKDEITPAEHAQFFKHLTHGFGDPLETIHFRGEGSSEYTALLYIPSERPLDLFDPQRDKSHVSLYVRRVFVMEQCEELLPAWLRFVHGVVDSSDLPLNVSREILQQNKTVSQIRKRLVKKVLDTLANLLATRRDDYLRFWRAFGTVLKEGYVVDREHEAALLPLFLCATTKDDALTTFDEYVARMPAEQKSIDLLAASDPVAAKSSPHLEQLAARGFEVLLFSDPIDDWIVDRLRDYKGKPVVALGRGELDLEGEADKFERERQEREHRGLLERLESELAGRVEKVRLSSRLKESPAVLVDDEFSIGSHMERLMRNTGQEPPKRRRILELNAEHPLIARLRELQQSEPSSPKLKDWADLLHGQALLAEGSPLPDPAKFAKLLSRMLVGPAS